jgi:hypothetical protein
MASNKIFLSEKDKETEAILDTGDYRAYSNIYYFR